MSVPLPPAFRSVDLDRWRAGSSGRAALSDEELRTIAGGGAGPTADEVLGVYAGLDRLRCVADRAASVRPPRPLSAARTCSCRPRTSRRPSCSASPEASPSARARSPGRCRSLIERWPSATDGPDRLDRRVPAAERRARCPGPDDAEGLPRSYDRRRCSSSWSAVKSGSPGGLRARVLPRPTTTSSRASRTRRPTRRIDPRGVERPAGRPARARRRRDASIVSDHLDMSIYVDADERHRGLVRPSFRRAATGRDHPDRQRLLPPVRRAQRRRGRGRRTVDLVRDQPAEPARPHRSDQATSADRSSTRPRTTGCTECCAAAVSRHSLRAGRHRHRRTSV